MRPFYRLFQGVSGVAHVRSLAGCRKRRVSLPLVNDAGVYTASLTLESQGHSLDTVLEQDKPMF